MREIFLVVIILIILTSCGHEKKSTEIETTTVKTDSIEITSNDLEDFLKSIKNIKNYYSLGDTISSYLYESTKHNSIDTIYLLKYHLVDTTFDLLYKPERLRDYHCSLLGKYNYNGFYILLTNSVRTLAGDGSPMFSLVSLSHKGVFIDNLRTNIYFPHDPEIVPITYYSISPNFKISILQKEVHYKIKKDKLVKTDSTMEIEKYELDNSGHFVLIKK